MAAPDAKAEVSISRYGAWPIDGAMRAQIVERVASNIAALSFFTNADKRIEGKEADEFAVRVEAEGFAAANEAATAGAEERSPSELVMAYARHCSAAMAAFIVKEKKDTAPAAAAEEGSQKLPGDAAVAMEVSSAQAAAGEGNVFDLSGGDRAKLDRERAEELLAPLLSREQAFAKVRLSNKSFGREAADVAARGLALHAATLADADLSDIIAGQPEEDALAALRAVCGALRGSRLTALDLSDNALGEKGVRTCAAALEGQTALQQLSFCNNGISVEAAGAITELLPSARELRALHFHNNMSGDGGAEAIAAMVRGAAGLASFRFSSSRVGPPGGVALADALAAGSSLVRLDLRDNMLGEEGGAALARALPRHEGLRELYLSDAGLGDEAVIALAGGLQSSAPSLEVLELGGNEISAAAAPALALCLSRKTGLRRLALGENELGDRGAVAICGSLSAAFTALEELDLNTNEIGRVGAVAAAAAVKDKPRMKAVGLNLNGNRISEEGIGALKEKLGERGELLGQLDENDEAGDEGEEEEAGEGKEESSAEVKASLSSIEAKLENLGM